jgi:copper transport protein
LKSIARLLAVAAVLAATVAVGAARVSAHASLVSSNPTDKQVLAGEPATISMTFTDNLAAAPGSFITVSTGGKDANTSPSAIGATDTKTMTIALKAGLGNGTYSVFWKTTSADDGGVTFGHFSFFVGQPDAATLSSTAAGAAVAVPDAATDRAQSAGGTMDVKLAAGCNLVALTFDDATPAATVAAAVAPAGAVTIYRYDATAGKYAGYSSAASGASDLKTVDHLDAVWICTGGAATLTEPNG